MSSRFVRVAEREVWRLGWFSHWASTGRPTLSAMSNTTYSPDGAWRGTARRWVPNQQQSPAVGASRNGMLVPALVAGGVALIPVLIRLGGDTVRAFGDQSIPGEQPWYFDTWFVVVQFLLGVIALATGVGSHGSGPGSPVRRRYGDRRRSLPAGLRPALLPGRRELHRIRRSLVATARRDASAGFRPTDATPRWVFDRQMRRLSGVQVRARWSSPRE